MRKYLAVLTVAFLSVASVSYATMEPPEKGPEKYTPSLTYTPPSSAAANSAGVTFAIGSLSYWPADVPSDLWMQELVPIKKIYNGKMIWSTFPQFGNLDEALKQDFQKILMAKGFNIRGPFDSYDLIPYADKKGVDLYLTSTLGLTFALNDEKWEDQVYSVGNVTVDGKITLELREIVTRELMWTKTIPLAKIEFPYRIRGPYQVEGKFNIIMNETVKGLEKQYPDLTATISKLIDPEETRIIKKQAQELKSKKGY